MLYDKEIYEYIIPVMDNISEGGFYQVGLNYYPVFIHTTMGDNIAANKELIIENNVRVVYYIQYLEDKLVYVPVRVVTFNKDYFSKNRFTYKGSKVKVLCQSDTFMSTNDELIEILLGNERKKVHVHELERLPNTIFDFIRLKIRKFIRNIFFDKRYEF